ncbi:MAG TPA: serine/threonine-protein kinase [Candidatus Krumholzibacteria bacterium]|nr:serine/threonine-protein kinase [Candidatus Krumholzibacteria bacterium]
MDRERHERLEELFHRALEVPGEQRAAFLDDVCGTDTALRAELEALLAEDAGADEVIRPTAIIEREAAAPETIGPYRVIETLGEGGFATVYSAWQEEPVRRKVAVKVLKPGLDSKAVLTRFEAERQVLARMDHPSIARVYDAGRTEDGRPYFVMELVDGPDIVRYADHERLDVESRVVLMIDVCRAVQHAHQKGIIHRDLKPRNVLVTTVDDRPLVKVIDFGIAKAVSPDLGSTLVFTTHGQFVGTPEYCSPEQADPGNLDVDTRADVYSLGVLAYELLTGTLPFPRESLMRAGLAEVLRVLREETPPRPSTRVSTAGGDLDSITSSRKTDERALTRRLRGELDWILLKALEKERTLRYETANGLAMDLRRFLDGDVVLAGPPSVGYRLRKTLRRYRVAVTVTGAFIGVLVAFAAVMTVQAQRIAVARDEAEREARTAERTASFLGGLFEYSDPGESRGRVLSSRELLDLGAEKIDEDLQDEPLVRANLLVTLGQVYRRIDEAPRAVDFLEQAVALREQHLGDDALETIYARASLVGAYIAADRFGHAIPLAERNVTDQARLRGATDRSVLRARHSLANLYLGASRVDDAIALYGEVWEVRRRVLGDDDKDTLYAQYGLANAHVENGRDDLAEPLMREALERLRVVRGEDHHNTLMIMAAMGRLDARQGRTERAIALLEEALAGQIAVYGEASSVVRGTRTALENVRSGRTRD